jgi:hypothetical protein
VLQNRRLNQHIAYVIVDEVWCTVPSLSVRCNPATINRYSALYFPKLFLHSKSRVSGSFSVLPVICSIGGVPGALRFPPVLSTESVGGSLSAGVF